LAASPANWRGVVLHNPMQLYWEFDEEEIKEGEE